MAGTRTLEQPPLTSQIMAAMSVFRAGFVQDIVVLVRGSSRRGHRVQYEWIVARTSHLV
jgi:hypothetical protein